MEPRFFVVVQIGHCHAAAIHRAEHELFARAALRTRLVHRGSHLPAGDLLAFQQSVRPLPVGIIPEYLCHFAAGRRAACAATNTSLVSHRASLTFALPNSRCAQSADVAKFHPLPISDFFQYCQYIATATINGELAGERGS